jgi:MAF protein
MIILASKSKARRLLLKNLGVKFKVVAPRVKEHQGSVRAPIATVKSNALLKAREVAGRLRKGIVIGCDTLVWQDGRVFGKPKNLKEAKDMLKRLSSKPHVLYSGIAVVDPVHHKEVVDAEETRIVMEKLSDKEIARYFKKVSPLEWAGGFDIQGLGGFFIKRIEGCYFNVVGLPLAKLRVLLKKMDVSLLVVFCSFLLWGCTTEFNVGTNKEDRMMYSTDKEVNIGDALSKEVERDYILINDPELNARLLKVGEKIAAVCDRREILYRFRIIEDKKDSEIVNAVSLPGGYVYVFKKLLKVADTDDELAAVVGHEVGHIVARHAIKRLQAEWGYNILTVLTGAGTRSPDFTQGVQLAYLQLLMGYSREDELVADKLGARYSKRAGYNPDAMLSFLRKLNKIEKKEEPRPLSYFRTHPNISQRIKATKEELNEKISFEDFINTY